MTAYDFRYSNIIYKQDGSVDIAAMKARKDSFNEKMYELDTHHLTKPTSFFRGIVESKDVDSVDNREKLNFFVNGTISGSNRSTRGNNLNKTHIIVEDTYEIYFKNPLASSIKVFWKSLFNEEYPTLSDVKALTKEERREIFPKLHEVLKYMSYSMESFMIDTSNKNKEVRYEQPNLHHASTVVRGNVISVEERQAVHQKTTLVNTNEIAVFKYHEASYDPDIAEKVTEGYTEPYPRVDRTSEYVITEDETFFKAGVFDEATFLEKASIELIHKYYRLNDQGRNLSDRERHVMRIEDKKGLY